jgi:hypothetical protein
VLIADPVDGKADERILLEITSAGAPMSETTQETKQC